MDEPMDEPAARRWCTARSDALRALGPTLGGVIFLNAVAVALPLTALQLLIVRDIGLEHHPEKLNAYSAARFAPSLLNALFGLLSDRLGRRIYWVGIGLTFCGASLIPFASGALHMEWELYLVGLPGAIAGVITMSSLEGLVVQTGRAAADTLDDGRKASELRSGVQAADYQLRGWGSLIGYLLAAALPSARITLISAAACYVCAAGLCVRFNANQKAAADPAASTLAAVAPLESTQAPVASADLGGATASPRTHLRRALLRRGASAWRWLGGSHTLACATIAFIYELPPTAGDSYSAYVYSSRLKMPSALLATSGGLNFLASMCIAALLYERLALPPHSAFFFGAACQAVGNLFRLAVVCEPSAPSAYLYLTVTVAEAVCSGLGFLPVVVLAAHAAPVGAEGSVFGTVLTAQTLGALCAAAGSAWLCTVLRIGDPSVAESSHRDWSRLPHLIALCSALKLIGIVPLLPLLAHVRRSWTQTVLKSTPLLTAGASVPASESATHTRPDVQETGTAPIRLSNGDP